MFASVTGGSRKYVSLRILGMSWGVKTTSLEGSGMSLGGSGVSIGGGRWSLRVAEFHLNYVNTVKHIIWENFIATLPQKVIDN